MELLWQMIKSFGMGFLALAVMWYMGMLPGPMQEALVRLGASAVRRGRAVCWCQQQCMEVGVRATEATSAGEAGV